MGVASNHDGGALGHPQIALAQFDALALGQFGQLLDRAVGEPCIGRMRDRLLLDGGVDHHPFEVFALNRPVRCATDRLSCNRAAICSSPNASASATSDRTAVRAGT